MPRHNPYQSPAHLDSLDGRYLLGLGPGARARLVARGLLYRKLNIEAPIEATLEFHGRGLRDKVLVNGRIVAWQTSWWRITPRLEFTLLVDQHEIPGVVELRVWPWLALRRFRVEIAGREVYRE